jgi:hypothetical protein
MLNRPGLNQPQFSRRQAAFHDNASQRDHGITTGLLGVKMGRRVLVVPEVHANFDFMEPANFGHSACMFRAP